MPKEHSPSDRVQLRSQGELMHPGSCALCGSGNSERGYVDPDIYFDYEGQVYFCVNCTEEIAGTIGMLTVEEVQILKDLSESLALANKSLAEQLRTSNERLSQYDALFSERLDSLIVHPSSSTDLSPSEDAKVLSFANAKSTGSTDSGESSAEESVKNPRPSKSVRSEPSSTGGFTV